MRRLCVVWHHFSFWLDATPLSLLLKAVIGCPVCCLSVIGSYQTKRLYLIGSGSAFGSVLNESDKGVSCLNFEFDIFRFSLGECPLCPAKTNYSSGKDKNVKRLSPLLRPIIHLLICFFFCFVFFLRGGWITLNTPGTSRQDSRQILYLWAGFVFPFLPDLKWPPISHCSIRGISEK